MDTQLTGPEHTRLQHEITISGSKSESNRLLLLQALYPGIQIENLSNSDDTRLMQEGLRCAGGTVDIHHAGTAMRFLTAYYPSREGRLPAPAHPRRAPPGFARGPPRRREQPVHFSPDAHRPFPA